MLKLVSGKSAVGCILQPFWDRGWRSEAGSLIGSQISIPEKALRNMVFPFTTVLEEVEDVEEASEGLSDKGRVSFVETDSSEWALLLGSKDACALNRSSRWLIPPAELPLRLELPSRQSIWLGALGTPDTLMDSSVGGC